MKLGALDYLQKPFEIDELLVVVERALEHSACARSIATCSAERDEEFNHYGIVGRSRAMQEVMRTRRAGRADQEHGADHRRDRHRQGARGARDSRRAAPQRDMPLVKVNCAAIPGNAARSELFGHVRGAFTGATTTKKGRFELADGGTIFLDEIGTMSRPLQAKLLRVLQEREFEPLGTERTQKVDVRVIAATNRDLRQMVAEDKFQEDLFYRLNVIPIVDSAAARAARRHSGARRSLRQEARAARRQARSIAWKRRARARCRPTTGRATCASSRTRSSAAWCSRPAA